MAMPSDDVADSVRSGLCAAAGKARQKFVVPGEEKPERVVATTRIA